MPSNRIEDFRHENKAVSANENRSSDMAPKA